MTTTPPTFPAASMVVAPRGAAVIAMNSLFSRSAWFAMTPLPDGAYRITFRDQEGHQQNLASKLQTTAVRATRTGYLPTIALLDVLDKDVAVITPDVSVPPAGMVATRWEAKVASMPPQEVEPRLFVMELDGIEYLMDAATGNSLAWGKSGQLGGTEEYPVVLLISHGKNKNWPAGKDSLHTDAAAFLIRSPKGRKMLADAGLNEWMAANTCERCDPLAPGVRPSVKPSCAFKQHPVPAGFMIVERCDTCSLYPDDLAAAKAFGSEARWHKCDTPHPGCQHAICVPPKFH